MRIPPILAIFLLHPRNLEARHDPGLQLLASNIQVLKTIILNKSIFLQGDWHRSKRIFFLHLQGGRFWKRGDLIFQVSSTSWKAGRLVPAKIPNVVSCARSCITLEQHNPCSCNTVTYTRSQRHTCCWYISWLHLQEDPVCIGQFQTKLWSFEGVWRVLPRCCEPSNWQRVNRGCVYSARHWHSKSVLARSCWTSWHYCPPSGRRLVPLGLLGNLFIELHEHQVSQLSTGEFCMISLFRVKNVL